MSIIHWSYTTIMFLHSNSLFIFDIWKVLERDGVIEIIARCMIVSDLVIAWQSTILAAGSQTGNPDQEIGRKTRE